MYEPDIVNELIVEHTYYMTAERFEDAGLVITSEDVDYKLAVET